MTADRRKILWQTTIETADDDWSIARFSQLAMTLSEHPEDSYASSSMSQ